MSRGLTYLDHNATTPLKPEVKAAIAGACDLVGNASSVHRHGRLVRRAIEEAREAVAQLVSTKPEDVIFTSGGTEANNLALGGFVAGKANAQLIVSAIEHDSVLETAKASNAMLHLAPVHENGLINLVELEALLAAASKAGPCLVSVMLANNETGVLQPAEEIARLAETYSALFHCDAVQAAGKIPIDFASLGAHMLTLSAHKLGGPAGVGALVIKEGIILATQITGGGQERSRRSGTENSIGIAGFGKAATLAVQDLPVMTGLMELQNRLERALAKIAPDMVVFGDGVPRLPNTTCFGVSGLAAETQVMALDLAGISISAGAACSSGKVSRSHVLDAMKVPQALADSALRVSLGWNSKSDDVDAFITSWGAYYEKHVPPMAASAQR